MGATLSDSWLPQITVEQVDVSAERERRRVVTEPPRHLHGVPALSNSSEAHVCRNVWKPTHGTPASSAVGFNTRSRQR
jgi:hypothetical protein